MRNAFAFRLKIIDAAVWRGRSPGPTSRIVLKLMKFIQVSGKIKMSALAGAECGCKFKLYLTVSLYCGYCQFICTSAIAFFKINRGTFKTHLQTLYFNLDWFKATWRLTAPLLFWCVNKTVSYIVVKHKSQTLWGFCWTITKPLTFGNRSIEYFRRIGDIGGIVGGVFLWKFISSSRLVCCICSNVKHILQCNLHVISGPVDVRLLSEPQS